MRDLILLILIGTLIGGLSLTALHNLWPPEPRPATVTLWHRDGHSTTIPAALVKHLGDGRYSITTHVELDTLKSISF